MPWWVLLQIARAVLEPEPMDRAAYRRAWWSIFLIPRVVPRLCVQAERFEYRLPAQCLIPAYFAVLLVVRNHSDPKRSTC